jgi:ribosomal protein S18 acetylase RimI-like enzyme
LFVAASRDEVVGSVMAGYDGRRGWINYLAVLPTYRRRGLGTTLMATAEGHLTELGCRKVNLQVRESNPDVVSFYVALGYMDDHVMSMGKRLR